MGIRHCIRVGFSGFLCLQFFITTTLAQARNDIPIRPISISQLEGALTDLNRAFTDLEKHGPSALVDDLSAYLLPGDRNYLVKKLALIDSLGRIRRNDSTLVFELTDGQAVAILDLSAAQNGQFKDTLNGWTYSLKGRKSLAMREKEITALLKKRHSLSFFSWIIPEAQATPSPAIPGLLVALAGVVLAVLHHMLNRDPVDEKGGMAANVHGSGDMGSTPYVGGGATRDDSEAVDLNAKGPENPDLAVEGASEGIDFVSPFRPKNDDPYPHQTPVLGNYPPAGTDASHKVIAYALSHTKYLRANKDLPTGVGSKNPRLSSGSSQYWPAPNKPAPGLCWRYVKMALWQNGNGVVKDYPGTTFAKQAGPELLKDGFVALKNTAGGQFTDPGSAPVGAVIVYAGLSPTDAGHIEIKTDNGYVSDFEAQTPLGGRTVLGIYIKPQ